VVQKYLALHEAETKRKEEGGVASAFEETDASSAGSQQDAFPRGLAPGAFMACNVVSPTEVLVITADDFNERVYEIAEKDLERRLDVLRASHLFTDDLGVVDFVRMARMSRVERCSPGTVIVKQGETPSKLFFVSRRFSPTD
jgi:hypothetical protein